MEEAAAAAAAADRILRLEEENSRLVARIRQLEEAQNSSLLSSSSPSDLGSSNIVGVRWNSGLCNRDILRYSRQLLLPELSTTGQAKLLNSGVLIVGAGGLGASVALYLAAAGVGRLGIVDFDAVDSTNLHRQIIHNESRIGMHKALSAKLSCLNINSNIQCDAFLEGFTPSNGLDFVKRYDVIVDASDNVGTRYLISDACCIAGKPLVSGSALRWEGQLTVYNYQEGPCYRCMHPQPPPKETVTNCSDGGVLGVVPGIIGCLQALETQKIIVGAGDVLSQRMLLFNGLKSTFRVVRLRGRQTACVSCGDRPLVLDLTRYDPQVPACDMIAATAMPSCATSAPNGEEYSRRTLNQENRISVEDFNRVVEQTRNQTGGVLLDVRSRVQYNIAALEGSINLPLAEMNETTMQNLRQQTNTDTVYVICRRGVHSVSASQRLLQSGHFTRVVNVDGGLTQWAHRIDPTFPLY